MKIVAVTIVSWVFGFLAYLAAGWEIWHQRISPGDLRAAIFWSALAAVVAVVFAFAPVMFALRERVHGPAAPWVFMSVGVALGFFPVLFIVTVWSNNIGRALLSPEAALFYFMFGIFGAVFGAGFFLGYGHRSA